MKMDQREEMALSAMGDVGPWQYKLFVLMAYVQFPSGCTLLGMIFLGAHVDFHCVGSSKECEDAQGEACTKWEYNKTVFNSTIVTEWDLVCSKSQLVNFAQMTFMVGIMLGTMFFCIAADRFGRKKPLIAAGVMQLVTGIAVAFAPWFWSFIALRFLQALSVGGCMTISFVLCMEVLNGKWRTRMSTLTHLPFNIGTVVIAGLAWLTRNWRGFEIAISLPNIVILLYPWLIPESPRWLMAVGRDKEALQVLRDAATKNKNPIPDKIPPRQKNTNIGGKTPKVGVMDLFQTPNLRKKTLIVWLNWVDVGLCFYGLEQYLSEIGGDIFINVFLSGACVIPSVFGCIITMDKKGRRWTALASKFVAAACCFTIILFPKEAVWWRVSLAIVGASGAFVAFITFYLYSTELFPTVVRNIGLGTSSMCARVGTMIAPFVASLNRTLGQNAPAIMFGSSSCITGLLCLLLPETVGTLLPNTLEEGEAFTGKTTHVNGKDTNGGKDNNGYVVDEGDKNQRPRTTDKNQILPQLS